MELVERTKVIRIIARLNVGGPAVHCDLLSSRLNSHGFETILVTGATDSTEADFEKEFGLTAGQYRLVKISGLRRTLNPLNDLSALVDLFRLMKKEKPAIVHTHTAKAGLLGRLAAFLNGVPVVVHTYHGHVLSGYFPEWFNKLLRAVERLLATRTTALVTLSPLLKNELSGKFRVASPSKFHVIPLGRILKPFLEMPRMSGKLRRELGATPETLVIGIVGRLVPIKAHELLFKAVANVQFNGPWVLAIVGEGPLRGDLEKLAVDLGIAKHIQFLGWRTDLPALYSDFDFSVICSKNEGTPLSIIESFAAGCPVVATTVGGVADMFSKPPREGILIAAEEVEALGKAIHQMCMEKAGRESASLAAREKALEYSDSALSNRMAELYRTLLTDFSKRATA